MPYIKHTSDFSKFRLLISGFSNSGKTRSAQTFIYGSHDYFDPDSQEAAIEYASDCHMVIIECPGEVGHRSLPPDTPHITSYYYETSEGENVTDAKWSKEALQQFDAVYKEATAFDKPDILFIDGLHELWKHLMNRATLGDYLAGVDLNLNPNTGNNDPYRSAKFYNQTHNAFGQYLAALYHSSIPLIVCTTWEEWESGRIGESERQQGIQAQKYLWPAIPGTMAKGVVGRFDGRVSARLEKRCLHKDCSDMKENIDHYVWQFLPKNDVMGVGIKGLKVNKAMSERPWIHQDWSKLQQLIKQFS